MIPTFALTPFWSDFLCIDVTLATQPAKRFINLASTSRIDSIPFRRDAALRDNGIQLALNNATKKRGVYRRYTTARRMLFNADAARVVERNFISTSISGASRLQRLRPSCVTCSCVLVPALVFANQLSNLKKLLKLNQLL
ncbi:hypothetical protein L905_07605 [Agrobacterium sp. TS43]|nr:hypothetical protein K538_15895 [Agrobacterium tumefaciens GW4]KVK50015.1 hypothetical protein L903_19260 [Agrobacterium sp. JL28]KVK50305.1 hypothetical protein L904_19250 [Agrobacterium sp. LY4]KVK59349.1 hypothetical protein L905_07605 [Agrobacterium sp. TS43]KVK63062.1 hypothetical protein L906_18390 [Agrobacterium sp. TS45]KVK67588.1 hypothetical protein L907_18365 [Agrobacterium sp. C13]